MGKIEVSALIKAIQESVSLLVSDGIAPRERITDPVNDAARVQDLESGYSTEIDDIVNNIPDVPPTPASTLVPIYIQSGNLHYQSSVKNDTSKIDSYCYAIYEDENRTTPYVFDWGKRNVFGRVENDEFIPTPIQTQAELPSTTGANTGYILCVNKRSSPSTDGCLWLAWNSYQDGYNRYTTRYLMIYDDAMSAWLNSNHTDENPAGFNITTDFDYDSSKAYKVLAFVNASGIKVNDEYLNGISFSEDSGKVKIRLTSWTSSIVPAARIVFYAEDSE